MPSMLVFIDDNAPRRLEVTKFRTHISYLYPDNVVRKIPVKVIFDSFLDGTSSVVMVAADRQVTRVEILRAHRYLIDGPEFAKTGGPGTEKGPGASPHNKQISHDRSEKALLMKADNEGHYFGVSIRLYRVAPGRKNKPVSQTGNKSVVPATPYPATEYTGVYKGEIHKLQARISQINLYEFTCSV